jgi:hypothetical protein
MPAATVMRWGVVIVLAGCGPVDAPEHATGTTSVGPTDGVTTSGDAVTSPSATSAMTLDPVTGGVDTLGSEADSAAFIVDPDGPSPLECSTFEQDCPRGSKCMPWADDGGGWWNATRCTPIAKDANDVGEQCTAVGSGVSGVDDCVLGAMCWDVDPETLMGTCVALCQGSEANPTCPNPCTSCVITSDGTLTPCLSGCDPLVQDCAEGEACYAVSDGFWCAPHLSEVQGAIGDECEYLNACDPGLVCANAENVPGCAGSSCCTAFCNVDAEDVCDALLAGTSCVPWFEEGQEPKACIAGTVGFCAVAQ